MRTKKVNIYASGEIASKREMEAVLLRASFERQRQLQLQTTANELSAVNNRARGVSVGTAFGGTIEVSLRRPDGVCTYAILQPVEALEIIHQIAAACGCHIHIQPRNDFSSWREWRHVDAGGGHPQQTAYVPENWVKAREIPPPEKQPGLNASLMAPAAVKSEVLPRVAKTKERRKEIKN